MQTFPFRSPEVIELSPSIKILGVLLDQHLSYDQHIATVTRKCNAIIASLFKIRQHLTPEVLHLLVNLHVLPHVYYCLSVWGGAAKCHLHRIQKSINFAARLVTGLKRSDHISSALHSLGWPQISDMVQQHDCQFVFKAVGDGVCPDSIRGLFVARSDVTERMTRAAAAGDLHLPRCRLTQTQRGFVYRATCAWNQLAPDIRHASSRRAFIRALSTQHV